MFASGWSVSPNRIEMITNVIPSENSISFEKQKVHIAYTATIYNSQVKRL